MKIWPFGNRETRSDGIYSDAVLAVLMQNATGDGDIPAHTTAAEEIAVGLWGRAFASASVTPVNPATRALTPTVLAQIGRQLIQAGESLWEISVQGGRVVLDNAYAYEIGGDGGGWVYRLNFAHPSGMISRTVSSGRVIHCRYSVSAVEPWKGQGPFDRAAATLRLGSHIETRLGDESGTRAGYLIPVPKVDPALQADLNTLKGKSVLVGSTAGGWDQGAPPKGDFEPRRLGFNPPPTIEPLRDGVSRSLLAAAGVPPAMIGKATAGELRESYRQFLHAAAIPLSKLVTVELADKLDTPDLALGFDDLMASDISGRARAFQSLVNGGMEVDKAAALSGLISEDV